MPDTPYKVLLQARQGQRENNHGELLDGIELEHNGQDALMLRIEN